MFLRCHDELTLEMVTPEERKFIYDYYVKDPSWDFRQGEGISARLAEILGFNKDKITLANSIMFTLLGTPIVYYGDEFGKRNDHDFYKEMIQLSGKDDTRFLVRGKVDWNEVEEQLGKKDSFESHIFKGLSKMIQSRKKYAAFGRGKIQWLETKDKGLLAFKRIHEKEEILILINLSGKDIQYHLDTHFPFQDILGQNVKTLKNEINIEAYSYLWIEL